MAKGIYLGVGGVARKVRKPFVGVGGVARRVKKGYIGVGGVARPFFSEGPAYYGTVTPLSAARNDLAGASNGSYALFAGGYNIEGAKVNTVDAYNSSLSKSMPTALITARADVSGARLGTLAVFGFGSDSDGRSAQLDAYNVSLVRTNGMAVRSRERPGAAQIGSRAVFAGGGASRSSFKYVEAVDAALTVTGAEDLSKSRNEIAGASNNYHAVFAGGGYLSNNFYYYNHVDAYNAALTHAIPAALSEIKERLAGACAGSYVLFAGGGGSSMYCSTVDAYNPSLTRSAATALSESKVDMCGLSVSESAVFAGGNTGSSNLSSLVEVYDASLTRTILEPGLGTKRFGIAGAVTGSFAVLAGGYVHSAGSGSKATDIAEALTC